MSQTIHHLLAAASGMGDSLARLAGHRFVPTDNLGIAYGEELVRKSIRFLDVDMVFDVGASRGQYAIQLRRHVGYQGPLISFEPLAEPAAQLRRVSQSDPKWEVRQCAMAADTGTTTINVMAEDEFSSLLTPEPSFDGRFRGGLRVVAHETVPTLSLPEAVNDAPPFRRGLLKLDTQGTELQILRAGRSVLPLFPVIQVEVGFARVYNFGATFEELHQELTEVGFRLSGLFPNNRGHFPHLFDMDAVLIRDEFLTEVP
jgi:FkbM family methyltransferase